MSRTLLNLFNRVLNADYITLPESGASFFCEIKGSRLYIFFEKSNGRLDWLNNFNFPAKAYRDMENEWHVHRGFLRVWKSARDNLKSHIFNPHVKEILIAGYSHGAALALLCHEFCVFHRADIADKVSGFGFGCPRVVFGNCNNNVCARFKNFYVIRNCQDIVTHLPPRLFGFRHVGNMIHIGKDAGYGPIKSHKRESYLEQLAK